jgi:hypothetical protein
MDHPYLIEAYTAPSSWTRIDFSTVDYNQTVEEVSARVDESIQLHQKALKAAEPRKPKRAKIILEDSPNCRFNVPDILVHSMF